jgi:hypothetical protein
VADRPLGTTDDGERGSAVVDFVMVSMLIVALLLAVLQVAVYVHVRNVVVASAQDGARYAANADVDSAAGAARTVEVVARATSIRTAEGLSCASAEEVDAPARPQRADDDDPRARGAGRPRRADAPHVRPADRHEHAVRRRDDRGRVAAARGHPRVHATHRQVITVGVGRRGLSPRWAAKRYDGVGLFPDRVPIGAVLTAMGLLAEARPRFEDSRWSGSLGARRWLHQIDRLRRTLQAWYVCSSPESWLGTAARPAVSGVRREGVVACRFTRQTEMAAT